MIPPKPEERWNHGATFSKDGDVRFTSVSALELGGRCLRRYKARYGPLKLKDEETKSLKRGNDGHYAIEIYEKTGERGHLTPDILSGLHQIPPPGPDLLVEQPLVPDLPGGKSGLAHAKLRADGIPVVGKIDLIHGRAENYGVQDIRDARDEPGVLKLIDWKFVGDLKNTKADHELVDNLQMAGYAKWAFQVWPNLERVRLTHGYFPLRGTPRVATTVVTQEQVERTWKRADAIGVSLRHAAKEPDLNRIDANTRDCHAYGRPCPALVAGVCTAHKVSSLADYVGVTAAEELINASSLVRRSGESQTMTQPHLPNSIMAAVVGASTSPASYAPVPAAAPDLASEMARLQGQLGAVSVPPPAPALAPELAALDQMINQITSYGMGFPTVSGEAAAAYARLQAAKGLTGFDQPGTGYAGTGELGKYNIPTVAHLQTVLTSVAQHVAMRNQAAPVQAPQTVAQVTPPEAPQSTVTPPAPAPITQVVEQPQVPAGATATVTTALPAAPAGPTAEELKAQEKAVKEAEKARKKAEKEAAKAAKAAAEEAAKQAAAQVVEAVTAPVTAPVAQAVETVTAPIEAQATAVIDASSAPPAPAPIESAPSEPLAPATSSRAINLYIDTVVEGVQLTSFWPIVDRACAILTKQSGCRDFRDVPKDNALSYRWEGALTALLNEADIPPGDYSFDGTWGPIGRVVVEAMRRKVRDSGGVFVKGVR